MSWKSANVRVAPVTSRPVSGAEDCLLDGGGVRGSLPLSSMDTFGSMQV